MCLIKRLNCGKYYIFETKEKHGAAYLDPKVIMFLHKVNWNPCVALFSRVQKPIVQYDVSNHWVLDCSIEDSGDSPNLFGPDMCKVMDDMQHLICILSTSVSAKT